MTASHALALRAAIHQRLVADVALSGLLGGPKIYDEPPRAQLPPYVALGDTAASDFSGDEAPTEVHAVSLDVWSREGGLSEALKAADRVVRVLDGADLSPTGCRLAMIDWVATDASKIAEGGLRRATVRFRAVTEPL